MGVCVCVIRPCLIYYICYMLYLSMYLTYTCPTMSCLPYFYKQMTYCLSSSFMFCVYLFKFCVYFFLDMKNSCRAYYVRACLYFDVPIFICVHDLFCRGLYLYVCMIYFDVPIFMYVHDLFCRLYLVFCAYTLCKRALYICAFN